jgi:outer membrane receptor protein involved in Fe transport
VTWDITSHLSLLGGLRQFKYDNSLAGFRGFGANNPLGATSGLGEQGVCAPVMFNGAPCTSFDKDTSGTGNTPKATLTYKFDDKHLLYATYSKGFRPGGINRVGDLPPYQADFLKNYEIGWKTSWIGNRLRFNGALFWEDWDNFQFSFLGANSLTRIANAGAARIKGMESDLAWALTPAFTLTAALSLLDPKITENYCGAINPDGSPVTNCATPLAPTGTQLPGTSKIKGNLIGRYAFGLLDYEAFAQGAFIYQSSEWDDLRIAQREALGQQPGYGVVDLSIGAGKKNYTLELYLDNVGDRRGQNYRFTQCGSCSPVANYVIPTEPRTIGLKFEQKF